MPDTTGLPAWLLEFPSPSPNNALQRTGRASAVRVSVCCPYVRVFRGQSLSLGRWVPLLKVVLCNQGLLRNNSAREFYNPDRPRLYTKQLPSIPAYGVLGGQLRLLEASFE